MTTDRASGPGAPGPGSLSRQVIEVRLPPGEVARTALVLVGVGFGLYLLWRLQELVFLLLLAILLATAIEPAVNFLRRGPFSRGAGVLVVYTGIVAVVGLPALMLAPSLVAQAGSFGEQLPERIDSLRAYALHLEPGPLRQAAVGAIDRVGAEVRNPTTPPGEQIVAAGATAVHTIISFFTVFVLAFYWLVERSTLKRTLLRLVGPGRARGVNAVWMEVEQRLGGWVRGQIVLMVAVGVMAAVGFTAIGLPSPILLAAVSAVFEIIPLVGPWIAFLPAALVALAIDPTRALLVLGFSVVVQQIESNVLVPRVMSQTVGISPLTVLIGILAGAILYGIPGALVAVPLAAAVQVVLAHSVGLEESSQVEEYAEQMTRPLLEEEPPTGT